MKTGLVTFRREDDTLRFDLHRGPIGEQMTVTVEEVVIVGVLSEELRGLSNCRGFIGV